MKFAIMVVAIVAAAFAFVPERALAQDASRCVSIGSAKYGQSLTNRCNRKIEVLWCHNNSNRKYAMARCGRKDRFYQQHKVLNPGETHDNMYTLPGGARINYGACFGGYSSARPVGDRGRYNCKT